MPFVRDTWYMAGWSEEFGADGLARRLFDRPLFLYRLENGGIGAILDRCPHRFAPFSKGTRDGDSVVCGYHGLAFSPAGKCVHNPFSSRLPAGSDVPAFAAEERDGIVWVWGGRREEADPSLIPDFGFIPDSATRRTLRGYTLMHANYEYGTDNLLDLSHIEFVHRGTFAGGGVIFAGEHSITMDGDTLHSNWWMPNIPPPHIANGIYAPEMRVDHWLDMRWNAPASMRLDAGVAPHGAGREAGFNLPQAHILTPADQHTTHYFWSHTRFSDLDNEELDTELRNLFGQAFDVEDKPIIEAAYANVRGNLEAGGSFWKEKPLSLGIDQGGTRARRILERMIAQEAA